MSGTELSVVEAVVWCSCVVVFVLGLMAGRQR